MTESTPKPPRKRRASKPKAQPAPKVDDFKIEAPQGELVEVVPAPPKPEPKPAPECGKCDPVCECEPTPAASTLTRIRPHKRPVSRGRAVPTRRTRTR